MTKPALERLTALGGILVSAVLTVFLVWFITFLTIPNGAGIDTTEAVVAWLSVGLLVLAVIASHLVYVRILLKLSKGERFEA
jgi:Mn2+/Fe2+ NRAMP family transporter